MNSPAASASGLPSPAPSSSSRESSSSTSRPRPSTARYRSGFLRGLQEEHGLSYIFISHDLAVVRAMADTILVMKSGQVVEAGPAEAIFARPQEGYTKELMAAAFNALAPASAA
jgi:ABC-type glutathione transport system ATPase component